MIHINLQPVQSNRNVFLIRAVWVLFSLTICSGAILNGLNHRLAHRIGIPAHMPIQAWLMDQGNEVEDYQSELATVDAKIAHLTRGGIQPQVTLLFWFTEQFPEKIWLTKIEVQERGKLLIQGESVDYTEIIDWMDVLKKRKDVKKVNLLSFEGEENLRFAIALEMDGDTG